MSLLPWVATVNAKMLDRFEAKFVPEPNTGCWLWVGALSSGYGKLAAGKGSSGARMQYAHRLSYEHFVGEIPGDMRIDHRCRNRSCVNPDHMEPVTNKVNILRGTSPTADNAAKTHCDSGHEFTADNTYVRPDGGGRQCRECRRARGRSGARSRSKVLTDEQVLHARDEWDRGGTMATWRALAAEWGVSANTVWGAASRFAWASLPERDGSKPQRRRR